MAEIELAGSTLIIHLKGLNKASASFNNVPLEIPLAHITSVNVGRSPDKLPSSKEDLGPNWFFGKQWSWEWSSGGKSKGLHRVNEFVEAGLDPWKVIEIELTNESYTKLVLRANDPAATAAWIMEAVQAYKS